MLSAEEILEALPTMEVDEVGSVYTYDSCMRAMRIYRNQGIQQASEVCSEMLTDGFRISNIPAVLDLKEEV